MKSSSLFFLFVNYFYITICIGILFFLSVFNLGEPCSLYEELTKLPFVYFWKLLFSNIIIVIILTFLLNVFYQILKIEKIRIIKFFKINFIILLLFDIIFIAIKLTILANFANKNC